MIEQKKKKNKQKQKHQHKWEHKIISAKNMNRQDCLWLVHKCKCGAIAESGRIYNDRK